VGVIVAKLLSKLSLKYQIFAIVGLAVVIFALVGALTLFSNAIQLRHSAEAEHFTHIERQADALAFALLDARRREKDFLARRTESEVEKHAAIIAEARQILGDLAQVQSYAQGERIASTLQTYADTFAQVVAAQKRIGYNEKEGALGNLRESVHAVEQLLKDHDEPRLAVLMLMMRRHEKDFLARRDVKYQADMDKRATEFTTRLATSSIPAAVQTDISEKMRIYHRDFKAVVQGTMELANHVETLSKLYAQMEPDIEGLRNDARHQAAQSRHASEAAASFGQWSILLAILIGGGAIAILGAIIARGIYAPLREMTKAMEALAKGSLDLMVPSQVRQDEVGAMGRALQVFKDNAVVTRQLQQQQDHLRQQSEQTKMSALNNMAETVERESRLAVERVAERTRTMADNAHNMSLSAQKVGSDAQGVAAAADQALANAQTVAAASEQLSASIAEISRQVSTATEVTHEAVQSARQAQDIITRLSQAVGHIDEVSALIGEIAGQTNLLALNATIEAARAGEAGKGFAVVAGEVKSLASQTARATGEISSQVAAIQQTTRHAVEAVEQIGAAIDKVEHISAAIAVAIEQQGAATGEIARNVSQTSEAANEVSRRIADVSDEARSTGSQAGEVNGVCVEVSHSIQMLRDTLIKVVRTSTREVDRRATARYSAQIPLKIQARGKSFDAVTQEYSSNGATIRLDGVHDLTSGIQVGITMEGLSQTIDAEIVAVQDGVLHVHFHSPVIALAKAG